MQVRVIQDENLKQPISLAGSTLRGVHGCHVLYMANMGSIASLVMAVVINDNDEDDSASNAGGQTKGRKLWGLIVCHHSTPRYVPFPLRSACEFLMQVCRHSTQPMMLVRPLNMSHSSHASTHHVTQCSRLHSTCCSVVMPPCNMWLHSIHATTQHVPQRLSRGSSLH